MPSHDPVILAVRHGRTPLNDASKPKLRAWANPPLDRLGQLDAQMAAQNIKQFSPKYVYSSDLMRDQETGEILAQLLGNLPFDIDFDLRTADMGDLEGMDEDEAAPLVSRWYDYPWEPAPGGGESDNGFLARFYPAFDKKFLLARVSPAFRPSVVVTHGRNLAALHARANMLNQKEARMPLPGGAMSVYVNPNGEMNVEFLGDSEPVHTDR